MKNITGCKPIKYKSLMYDEVEEFIYKGKNPYKDIDGADYAYFITLSFEQEPKYGEGDSSLNISQYPIEEILDNFSVAINDFCDEANSIGGNICYREFVSSEITNIKALKNIIGKHVFIKEKNDKVKLIIK